jgi:hypothetical protein
MGDGAGISVFCGSNDKKGNAQTLQVETQKRVGCKKKT